MFMGTLYSVWTYCGIIVFSISIAHTFTTEMRIRNIGNRSLLEKRSKKVSKRKERRDLMKNNTNDREHNHKKQKDA